MTFSCLNGILFYNVLTVLYAQDHEHRRYTPDFKDAVKVSTIHSHDVDEASGICVSRIHPNVLYTHNDSGDHSDRIYAIDITTGNEIAAIEINHATNKDWEDIACGPCTGSPGQWCVYIADIGGNVHDASNTIYRIREPPQLSSSMSVDLDSKLTFSWSEDNAETIMVDPLGETYIVSKVSDGNGKAVQLPSSAWGSSHRVHVGGGVHLKLDTGRNDPVGGDISPTGYEVLIKTIHAVNYYYVPDGDYLTHLSRDPIHIHYHHEHQGEAIAWNKAANGFYTLGEGDHEPLYYYERNIQGPAVG